MSSRTRFAALCLIAGFGAGCTPTVPPQSAGPDEHVEHHHPEHRPADFSAGVRAVRDRLSQLTGPDGTADREGLKKQAEELRDIIQWLPELAAETDLRRADWERVDAASRRLADRWNSIRLDAADDFRAGAARNSAAMEADLAELDQFAVKAAEIAAHRGPA